MRAALLLQLRSGSIFAPSFGSRPQTFVDDLAQQTVVGPGQELHRGDELGPHPMRRPSSRRPGV